MKKFAIIGLAVLLVGLITWHLWPKGEEAMAGVQVGGTDIIGTRIATSTTGVQFWPTNIGNKGTSTYYATSTGTIDTAIFTLKAVAASSTAVGSKMFFSFYGSNDYDCNTATTSTIYNKVVRNDINWYDIGTHIKDLAGSQTLGTGTSTLVWSPTPGEGKDYTFLNLDYQCFKVEASGSSTQVYMAGKFKNTY